MLLVAWMMEKMALKSTGYTNTEKVNGMKF